MNCYRTAILWAALISMMGVQYRARAADPQPQNNQAVALDRDVQRRADDAGPVSPTTENGAAEDVQEIVVTGSRLKSGFNTPSPVSILSSAQLQQMSPNDIAGALDQLPALKGGQMTTNAGSGSPTAGVNGENLLSLRNLGANRTLVLLDGDRLPPANTGGTVDINVIPQALVSRVDVVTGGASAAYGSDAVAGVVNFVLDTHFTGLKVDANIGETTYGDAGNGHLSAAYGTAFAGDRGRMIASVDYFRENGIGFLPGSGRTWFDNPAGAYPNPVPGAAPSTVVVPNVRSSIGTYGGLITSGPLKGMQFGPGGALEPFNYGTQTGSAWQSGGDGAIAVNGLSPDQHRESAFVHGEYDINDNVTWFAEGMVNQSHTRLTAQPPFEVGNKFQFTIFPNNAYLPASVAAMFAANPSLASFTVGRYMLDIAPTVDDDLVGMARAEVGVKGKFNDTWSYDAGFTYSRSFQNLNVNGTVNRNLYAAADAVVNPANGQVVCRSTLTGLDPGCQPINIFGPNTITSAGQGYIEGVNRGDTVFHQPAFNSNVRGDLGDQFRLSAGPISVALGLAYRRDDATRTVDALSNIYTSCAGLRGCPAALNGLYGGYQLYNPAPLHGSIGVTELYGELGIPLIKDIPFVKSLDADIAGRAADYSTSGLTYSWKLGANWSVNSDFRIRATNSQDVRAPNLTELFSAGTANTGPALYPASNPTFTGTPASIPQQTLTQGNPGLLPEIAHTTTIGLIYSPAWIAHLQTSLDYYSIRISDAITSVSAQTTINGCYLGNQELCRLITVDGVPITSTTQVTPASPSLVVTSETANLNRVSTSGIDFELAYSMAVPDGTLTSRVLGNYLLGAFNSANPPGTILVGTNGVGTDGASIWPRWTGSLSTQYDTSRFGIFLQERMIAKGSANPNLVAGVTISQNEVPLIAYTDMTLTYKVHSFFDSHDEIYFNVTNLFNRNPPTTTTSSSNWQNPTNYSLYDVLGRRFILGFRVRL